MTKKHLFATLILGIILISSCKTYLIPIDSFKQQFSGIDSSDLTKVKVRGPIGEAYTYYTCPIGTIKCFDKKGTPVELLSSPSIEIRFTHGQKNRKTAFYFDRIFVNDSCIVGIQSRFISSIRKTIPIDSVTKIEIQDGHKNYKYVGLPVESGVLYY